MATFYLLPPRALLGQRLLATLGISEIQLPLTTELAEALGSAVEATGAFVVFQDDLPSKEDVEQFLIDGFGAEVGDEVIEATIDSAPRRWRLSIPPLAA
jgi:hypothetical protein